MQKQAQQPAKGKEERGPLVQIKLGAGKASGNAARADEGVVRKGGFKKGGFKSAFGPVGDEEQAQVKKDENVGIVDAKSQAVEDEDSDFTDEEDYYDPRKPTGCMPNCKSRVAAATG